MMQGGQIRGDAVVRPFFALGSVFCTRIIDVLDPEIDTTNQFCVAAGGDHIRILRAEALRSIKPDEAVLLAAWLVAIAEPMSTLRFEDCLRAGVEHLSF